MRMQHYYAVLAAVLVPSLLTTAMLGATYDGSQTHLAAGLLTAMLCVATNTLLILFSIVTGRVLRAAMKARPLGSELLDELNEFFEKKSAYPVALCAAALAVAAAVLGYGRFIGVPSAVHVVVGVVAVLANLWAIQLGFRALRRNQDVLDRATVELDRIDRELGPAPDEAGEIQWSYPATTRWLVFTASAWAPYLYWGLVVWRGSFERVPTPFLIGTAIASSSGLVLACLTRRDQSNDPRGR